MNLISLILLSSFVVNAPSPIGVVEASKERVILQWDITDKTPQKLSVLLSVPEGALPQYSLLFADTSRVDGIEGSQDPLVKIGKKMILRDFIVVPVVVNPIRPGGVLIDRGKLEISIPSGNYLRTNRPPSLAFYPLYKSLIANFDAVSPSIDSYRRGSYLIVTHDDFYDAAMELAQWKTEEGWKATVVKLSDIGTNPSADDIKAFVENAYNTWDLPPDFLLLFGDVDVPSGGGVATFYYGYDATDRPYGLLEGDDYLPEIFVGRLAVDFPTEAQFAVQKTILYEKTPYMDETSWYRRALLAAGVYYQTEIVNTTRLTKLWVREKMLSLGYEADTVIGYQTGGGGSTQDVINSINQGVCFVNYRGWSNSLGWVWPQFLSTHIMNQIDNGYKMPVMFSITCGTGNYAASSDPSFGEAWIRAWDVVNDRPRGGPAVFAPSNPDVHTRWNNSVDVGLMTGLLDEGIDVIGPLTVRGLSELFYGFPGREGEGDSIEFYFHVYNLQGDPSLDIFTDVPHQLSVSLPQSIPLGFYALTVTVSDLSGDPLPEDAYLQISKGEEIYMGKSLYPSGSATFSFETTTEGTITVVITGRNLRTYIAEIPVVTKSHSLGLAGYSISDEDGNGEVNPGENIEIWPSIKNSGNVTESLVFVKVTEIEGGRMIEDSSFVGTIQPSETKDAQTPLTINTDSTLKDSDFVIIRADIKSNSGSYPLYVEIPVVAPKIGVDTVSWNDPSGNGMIDPGETADLYITLKNEGRMDFPSGTLTVVSGMTGVQVLNQEVPFPSVHVGSSSSNSDPIVVYLAPDFTPGRMVPFEVYLRGGSLESHITLHLNLGESTVDVPTGPDDYGYWVYDTKDTLFDKAPQFNWVELDPELGGNGVYLTRGDDSLFTFTLPFTFKFYGEDVETVTVSTNGWISFSKTMQFSPRNWPIPSPFGPPNLVAVFWDELVDTVGAVYGMYDEQNHRYIIEWSRAQNKYNDSLETFELILFDPQYWTTPSGDGEMLLQYKTVNDVDEKHYFSTVGIENFDHSMGLGYVYGKFYPTTAETLRDDLALLFTTVPPDTYLVNKSEAPMVSLNRDQVKVAPSPFLNQLRLSLRLTQTEKIGISLYDVTGRCIFKALKGPFMRGSYEVELNEVVNLKLSSGVYFLKVESSGNSWLFKLVKGGN